MKLFNGKFISWKIWDWVEKISIILLLLAGLFYTNDTVKGLLKKYIFEGEIEAEVLLFFYSAIGAAIVVLIFKQGIKSDKLRDAIDNSAAGIDHKLFFKGTTDIYSDVAKDFEDLRKSGKKIDMDILGFTLFSVKNKFSKWKESGMLENITVNLYYIDPNFALESPHIDDTWKDLITINVDFIKKFINDEQAYLRKKKVKINFYAFKHIPAVHGFRLNNSCIFVSFASWTKNVLRDPADSSTYIKIKNGDNSSYAIYLRELYANWQNRAKG